MLFVVERITRNGCARFGCIYGGFTLEQPRSPDEVQTHSTECNPNLWNGLETCHKELQALRCFENC